MKSKKYIIFLCSVLVFLCGCDHNFEEINSNPYATTSIDPPLLFANAVRQSHPGHWEGEQTVVQQFMNAYNLGATAGHNFNEDVDNFNTPKWNSAYPNTIKFLVKGIDLATPQLSRNNLIAMMRIWKAFTFMTLVDTYGDVPYTDAGKGDQDLLLPKYDDDAAIYDDLYNEIKTATDALDPAAEFVSTDLLYRTTNTAPLQVAKWKKLGNSLLLRLGMRYSKINPAKAASIAAEAVSRGVMVDNSDNAVLLFNSSYPNTNNNGIRNVNPYYYYVAEPFVNRLKSTNDPRAKNMIGKYPNPASSPTGTPDLTLANQFGFPVGYDAETIKATGFYRGTLGGGLNYSQLNYSTVGHAEAPLMFVTNAQTKLLMAEAAHRGWIAGSAAALYEEGIRAGMKQWSVYPQAIAITTSEENAYLAEPTVVFDASKALEQINTEYWLSNIGNGTETFANLRRSGFPILNPNMYNNNLNGGFVRRFPYPNVEPGQNRDNYAAAASAIGGDLLTTRVFWDVAP